MVPVVVIEPVRCSSEHSGSGTAEKRGRRWWRREARVPPVRSEQLVRRPYLQFCFHALYQDDDSIIVRVCPNAGRVIKLHI
jgi:hypothetical protein